MLKFFASVTVIAGIIAAATIVEFMGAKPTADEPAFAVALRLRFLQGDIVSFAGLTVLGAFAWTVVRRLDQLIETIEQRQRRDRD